MVKKTSKNGNVDEAEGPYESTLVEAAAVKWREEAKGLYVTFRDEPVHVFKVLKEVPEKVIVNFRGREKTAFRWPVEENGVERIWSVTSFRLLQKLRKIPQLEGKTLRVEYLPLDMDFKVEIQK